MQGNDIGNENVRHFHWFVVMVYCNCLFWASYLKCSICKHNFVGFMRITSIIVRPYDWHLDPSVHAPCSLVLFVAGAHTTWSATIFSVRFKYRQITYNKCCRKAVYGFILRCYTIAYCCGGKWWIHDVIAAVYKCFSNYMLIK